MEDTDASGMGGGKLIENLGRSVGRTIVDGDDFGVDTIGERSSQCPLDSGRDVLLLVIDGHDDGKQPFYQGSPDCNIPAARGQPWRTAAAPKEGDKMA